MVPRPGGRMEVRTMSARDKWSVRVMRELTESGLPTCRVGPSHRHLGALPADYGMPVWDWLHAMPDEFTWAVSDRLFRYTLHFGGGGGDHG